MKKKKQPAPKTKEFAARPFDSLKGVRTAPQAEPLPPKKPQPAPVRDVSASDTELFLRAVSDARISGEPVSGKRPPQLSRKPAAANEEDRAAFLDALKNLQLDVTFQDEAEDEDSGRAPVNRLRQLKQGVIRLDLQLDLHGLTRDQALQSLAEFIAGAYQRGQKGVLVITGKGNRSPGEPVLQRAVTGWLRDRGKGMVAEFAPAPRDLGGSGAFVIFLKNKI